MLTAKGAVTRQRIVAGAAAEIREAGIAQTTLDGIRARTGTSKSQLFHYFPSGKEELLLAVAQHEADRVLEDQQPQLSNLTSWRAWQDWRDAVLERYRTQGQHCPLGVLMSELGRSTPASQAVVTQLLQQWQTELADGVRAMQRSGKVNPRLQADTTAAGLLAGVQGGVSMLLSTGQLTHLEAVLDLGIAYLRSA